MKDSKERMTEMIKRINPQISWNITRSNLWLVSMHSEIPLGSNIKMFVTHLLPYKRYLIWGVWKMHVYTKIIPYSTVLKGNTSIFHTCLSFRGRSGSLLPFFSTVVMLLTFWHVISESTSSSAPCRFPPTRCVYRIPSSDASTTSSPEDVLVSTLEDGVLVIFPISGRVQWLWGVSWAPGVGIPVGGSIDRPFACWDWSWWSAIASCQNWMALSGRFLM